MKLSIFIFSILLFAGACVEIPEKVGNSEGNANDIWISADFKDYWYQGKAELTSFTLEQGQYGTLFKGVAVQVFVAEPFSRSRYVKANNPEKSGIDAVDILKLNMSKNFTTGVYPYSLLMTVALPIDHKKDPHAITANASIQEWCGHSFSRLDLGKEGYMAEVDSYFEGEERKKRKLPLTWIEDEIWNLIRVAPDQLPVGEIEMIPGLWYQRLKHIEPSTEKAIAYSQDAIENPEWTVFSLEYPASEHSLKITFEKKFPFGIQAWEETYVSGNGARAKSLTTRATLNQSIQLDYWNKNQPEDSVYRAKLGLD